MLQKYSSYVLCLLISILVVALYINDFSPLVSLERKLHDLLYSFRGDQTFHSNIVLVDIDDRTLDEYGDWPWHRDRVADLLAAVGSGNPKTVLLDILYLPDTEEDTAGYTGILAGQMSWIKNVILPYEISRAEFRTVRISTPPQLYRFSVKVNDDLGVLDENSTTLAHKVFMPPDQLCDNAGGMGFRLTGYDNDRKVRWQPLVMYYEGYYYPSVELMTAAAYLGVQPEMITVYGGEKITLGGREIPTNERTEMYINFNRPGESFRRMSAAEVLNEAVDFSAFTDKLVIVHITAERYADACRTPVSDKMWCAVKTANVIENIIHNNFITRYDSSPGIDMLILFALGGIFAFILPRVSLTYRLIILMVSMFILANLTFVLFNSYSIQTRFLYIGLELMLLLLAGPFLDDEFLARFSDKQSVKTKNTRLPEIRQLPGQSEKPARASAPKAIQETVKMDHTPPPSNTAMYAHTQAAETSDMDKATEAFTATPPPKNPPPTPNTIIPATVGTTAKPPSGKIPQPTPVQSVEYNNVVFDDSRPIEDQQPVQNDSAAFTPSGGIPQIKQLGRYQVSDVVGKGAMGMVYKGIDPAINRNVALKTIRLDFVNDPAELEELKERLFREAQAAGMLSHPNIVTIYDVGTEQNLQYIAMEYLEGQTLEEMIRRKVKFNYRIIAQIITQICNALTYAHNQGIVHRDIKPANIMVRSDYTVKVMDFGIARLDSSSMTRTGIAMGTPNYISPEQLQGRPVDSRTDIFSLGVMMYEMLVYRRPFRGENLTSLIYSIVNSEPPPPSEIDKSVPHLFDRVIERALKKNPEERYQKAADVANALADFIDSFSSKNSARV
ncbi:MAG: CHASE2 domain-containing protein [candidate division Zixibacteria bacterium]|nr:CHASE2 domain-containing protein [candidate division Zixibacteria bacterium]